MISRLIIALSAIFLAVMSAANPEVGDSYIILMLGVIGIWMAKHDETEK